MNIYIAAPFMIKNDMPAIAMNVEAAGHRITHKWWNIEHLEEVERSEALLREQAILDCEGVLNADAVILINSAKSEGKAVEQGLAIAAGIPIFAVGVRGALSKNVFHYLDTFSWHETLQEALNGIERLANELNAESFESY